MPRGRPELAAPALVTLLLEKRRKGRSYREIAAELNRSNVPTLGGGEKWYPGTIQKIVKRHEGEAERTTAVPHRTSQPVLGPNIAAAIKASDVLRSYDFSGVIKASNVLKSYDFSSVIRNADVLKAYDFSAATMSMSDVLEAYDFSGVMKASDVLKSYDFSAALKASDLLKAYDFSAALKASDLLKAYDFSAALKASDVLKGYDFSAVVNASELLKGVKLAGISDAAWRSAAPSASLLRQFSNRIYRERTEDWQGLLRDALMVRRGDLGSFVQDAADAAPAAGDELRAISNWLRGDAPPDVVADWLLWLSVPYQRRVLLLTLAAFYGLAMYMCDRADAELPSDLATLIPFLLAIATLLSEVLDRSSDGE